MSGPVLVTGATGFVGRALLPRLVARQVAVRAATRQSVASRDPSIDWRQSGDLAADVDWSPLVAGCSSVVHLAALAHQVGRTGVGRLAEFMAVNQRATQRLAQAAAAAGVERFVLLSSVGAVASTSPDVLDEATLCRPDTDYGRSKLAAEAAVADTLRGTSVAWCALRPPLIFGPGNPGNMDRLLRLLETGLPLPFGGIRNRRSFIFVDNVADAVAQAVTSDRFPQGVYFLDDGTCLSTPELVAALARAADRKARMFALPAAVLRLLGRAGDAGETLLRRSLPVDSYSVERLLGSLAVDGKRFRAATGWQPPVALEAALSATVQARL